GPLRYYVMGERAYEDHDATAADVAEMAKIVREAFDAGAAGFSTNRFVRHQSRSGKSVPGTFAPPEELTAIARAVGDAGHGIMQAIPDRGASLSEESDPRPELALLASLSMTSGRPLTFSTAHRPGNDVRTVLEETAAWNNQGAQLHPQFIPRSFTLMTTLGAYHPFMYRPTYLKLADLPLAERAAEMRRSEVRERILTEEDDRGAQSLLGASLVVAFAQKVDRLFSMAFPVDYEPDPSTSVKAQADAMGKEPVEHLYDLLVEGDGTSVNALLNSNFENGTLESCREMLLDPNTVSGLSDAGAHVMMISDCSSSTFHLTYWVRDRTKGERVPLELAVHKLTGAPAAMYGFADRGAIAEGRKADLNVIDFDNLTIQAPVMRDDLPTGARRILQPSTGYAATVVNGQIVRRHDQDTGVRPGHLIRSGRGHNLP
ncbi:MAG TPA: amidohydrolase family protein, partial [Acidimicrobiales bacterium]|nr:amidohydrolase family protein [Acidimicrobiales bacterium]